MNDITRRAAIDSAAMVVMEELRKGTLRASTMFPEVRMALEVGLKAYETAMTTPGDGRPAGWSETLLLRYIYEQEDTLYDDLIAHFVEGDWTYIQKNWRSFIEWMDTTLERNG